MERKRFWFPQEDEALRQIIQASTTKGKKLRWAQVCDDLRRSFPNSSKNAKQCWERWNYQLSPTINNGRWSEEEIEIFLHFHNIHGNKWALISKQLTGRTNSRTKNFFYNSLKKGIQFLNEYIEKRKNKKELKPIKGLVLDKLLLIVNQKTQKLVKIKEERVRELATKIKSNLIKLSNEMIQEENIKELIEDIIHFNQVCRKKKKKKDEKYSEDEEKIISDNQEEDNVKIEENKEQDQVIHFPLFGGKVKREEIFQDEIMQEDSPFNQEKSFFQNQILFKLMEEQKHLIKIQTKIEQNSIDSFPKNFESRNVQA